MIGIIFCFVWCLVSMGVAAISLYNIGEDIRVNDDVAIPFFLASVLSIIASLSMLLCECSESDKEKP